MHGYIINADGGARDAWYIFTDPLTVQQLISHFVILSTVVFDGVCWFDDDEAS